MRVGQIVPFDNSTNSILQKNQLDNDERPSISLKKPKDQRGSLKIRKRRQKQFLHQQRSKRLFRKKNDRKEGVMNKTNSSTKNAKVYNKKKQKPIDSRSKRKKSLNRFLQQDIDRI